MVYFLLKTRWIYNKNAQTKCPEWPLELSPVYNAVGIDMEPSHQESSAAPSQKKMPPNRDTPELFSLHNKGNLALKLRDIQ